MKNLYRSVRSMSVLSTVSILLASPLALAGHGHDHAEGVSPEAALEELVEGNKRFVKGNARHAHQDAEYREKLFKGQKPHTIILSCSDSRVPPELVFDQGLGQVFTIRVAGNTVGSDAVASIEYAVEHLGSKLLVVMGHESCGAVKAALSTPVGKSAGSFDLDSLVAKIRPNISQGRGLASEDKKLRGPVQENVNGVVCQLTKRSKILRERVKKGQLTIAPAIYGLESGKVDWWGAKGCGK